MSPETLRQAYAKSLKDERQISNRDLIAALEAAVGKGDPSDWCRRFHFQLAKRGYEITPFHPLAAERR